MLKLIHIFEMLFLFQSVFAYGSCSLSASQLEVDTHGTPVCSLKLENSIRADTLLRVAEKGGAAVSVYSPRPTL